MGYQEQVHKRGHELVARELFCRGASREPKGIRLLCGRHEREGAHEPYEHGLAVGFLAWDPIGVVRAHPKVRDETADAEARLLAGGAYVENVACVRARPPLSMIC